MRKPTDTCQVTTIPALSRAGSSADAQADLYAEFAEQTETQIRSLLEALHELRRREGSYRVGATGERQSAASVERVLVDLGSADWHLLADRRWPNTRRANIDLILVGPPGVLVLDVKTWRGVRIDGGSLWHGQDHADDEVDKVRRQGESLAEQLAEIGLAPACVRPYIVLTGQRLSSVAVAGVTVVGELSLQRELARLGPRLTGEQIADVVATVDEVCPPAVAAPPQRRVVPTGVGRHSVVRPADTLPLIDLDEVFAGAMEAAIRGPIEAWMAWLHPAQTRLVTRGYSGPARVRGPAGTGKTVVALHRARHLANRPDARVLVTSYVKTLPGVQRALFERFAPDLSGRVEFRGLHSWAMSLLAARGAKPRMEGAREAFLDAWTTVGQTGPLGLSALPRRYWEDEVRAVIKGRGLTDIDQYLTLDRVGRRTALREEQRRAVWDLFEAYQRRLAVIEAHDWDDVLLLALDSVRDRPVDPPYSAVVVDEVQDLTCAGLRLVHALVGDAPDGLFLVGDGQQSVYPGGFTLTEAGVSVTGRSTVLNRNYRNAAEVIRHALTVVSDDRFDDLESEPEPGARAVEVERPGGQVATVACDNQQSQRAVLIHALRWTIDHGTRPGDIAVLTSSNHKATEWHDALTAAGVPATFLREYDGHTVDAVKVGTYQRAKGLEFACVFLPDHDQAVPARGPDETDDAYRDRAELQRRQLFVAMTRARDRLWLGSVKPI